MTNRAFLTFVLRDIYAHIYTCRMEISCIAATNQKCLKMKFAFIVLFLFVSLV
jgi:hypothetical protein